MIRITRKRQEGRNGSSNWAWEEHFDAKRWTRTVNGIAENSESRNTVGRQVSNRTRRTRKGAKCGRKKRTKEKKDGKTNQRWQVKKMTSGEADRRRRTKGRQFSWRKCLPAWQSDARWSNSFVPLVVRRSRCRSWSNWCDDVDSSA